MRFPCGEIEDSTKSMEKAHEIVMRRLENFTVIKVLEAAAYFITTKPPFPKGISIRKAKCFLFILF